MLVSLCNIYLDSVILCEQACNQLSLLSLALVGRPHLKASLLSDPLHVNQKFLLLGKHSAGGHQASLNTTSDRLSVEHLLLEVVFNLEEPLPEGVVSRMHLCKAVAPLSPISRRGHADLELQSTHAFLSFVETLSEAALGIELEGGALLPVVGAETLELCEE